MFERFSDHARGVVVEAQAAARGLGHDYIGTEHLLLGVLRRADSPAAEVLVARGVTADAARARVEALIGPGPEPPSGQIPFTPRAKKVLELALRECISRRSGRVEPGHLVLGLLREGEGVAARILEDLVDDQDALRRAIIGSLPAAEIAAPRGFSAGPVPPRVSPSGPAPELALAYSGELLRLLMRAGARALDAGRTEVTVADVEAALRREPPQAAAG